MSEAADKICEAIIARSDELRSQVIGTLKIEIPITVRQQMGTKFLDREFQDGIIEKITDLLKHIYPDCCISFPTLSGGSPTCFMADRTPGGLVKTTISAEVYVFPKGGPK